jgi:hypothetical protein
MARGFQTLAVEFLDVGSKTTLSVVRVLRWTDDIVTGGTGSPAPSSLANTPSSIQEGGRTAL